MDGYKSMRAAEKYMANKGYEIVSRGFIFDLVCVDNNTIVFVDIDWISGNEFEGYKSEIDRSFIEGRMVRWLTHHDYSDMKVRYDEILVIKLNEDRALIRHHINALERV